MLGRRLRNSRRNTCKYKCCTKDLAYLRKTKQERIHDKKNWRKGVDSE